MGLFLFSMDNHVQILFEDITSEQSGLLIAALSEAGFEGFEEGENELKAFISAASFDETAVKNIADQYHVNFSKTIIEATNWNQLWESNFQPVTIDDFAGIRAFFHEPIRGVTHEIVITPKMSFGTGHHATTWMMISQMKEIDFINKAVLDFGTGTGILAILSEKLGATSIVALDHDDWSIENARENIEQNHAVHIRLQKADSALLSQSFDIILANINKTVIQENLAILRTQLKPGGDLLLSGLLVEDEEEIMADASGNGFLIKNKLERHNWLSMRFSTT
jgi:ribosomal protein L11 methyltransferase